MPSLAVIATWSLGALWLVLLGSPAAVLAVRRLGWLAALRIALWFGLAIAVLAVVTVNFFLPLASRQAQFSLALVTTTTVVVAVILGLAVRRDTDFNASFRRGPFPYWTLIVVAGLAGTVLAVAHAAFGVVDNWDAGLYHLNAIQYAAEYRVIPGLANVHDRFGVTNAQHLLTALLSGSGWGSAAFRLEVGFFVFLLAIEITLRLMDTRKTGSRSGTIILLLSAAGLIPFLLNQSDAQLTSPTPDPIALILIVIAAAYFSDGLKSGRDDWIAAGVVAAATAASVRSQLWVFFAITAAVISVVTIRRHRREYRPSAPILLGAALSIALVIGTQIRDTIQSGWVLFPLDIWALPVDWRYPDPGAARTWIVAWAREPGADPASVINNWSWTGNWMGRTATDWSVRWMVGTLAFAGILWFSKSFIGSKYSPSISAPLQSRAPMLLLVPIVLVLALWFLSAPDPRFAWGPIALLGVLPAAWVMTRRLGRIALPISAAVASLLLLPAALTTLGPINGFLQEGQQVVSFESVPWSISAALTPLPQPDVTPFALATGQELLRPEGGDQCWQIFPLCTPYPNTDIEFRGDVLENGLANRYLQ